MPTKSKTNADKLEEAFTKESAETTEGYDWITTDYGDYRIEETRWKMFRSVDRDGNALVIGMTEQAVRDMTPIHMFAHTPDYDGSYDVSVRADQGFVEL